jgi:hypothetical protein
VPQDAHRVGAHAFAIVGYDQHGFWFQNSWPTTGDIAALVM